MIPTAPHEVNPQARQRPLVEGLNRLSGVIIELPGTSLENQLRRGGQMFSQFANVTASVASFKANREPPYNDSPPAMVYNSVVEDHAEKISAAGDCVTVWLPTDLPGSSDLREVRVAYHYLAGAQEYDSTRRLGTDPMVRLFVRTGDDEAFQSVGGVGFHPYDVIDSATADKVSWETWTDDYLGRPYLLIGSGKTARTVELEFDANGQSAVELDHEAQGVIDTFNQAVAAFEGMQQQRANDLGNRVVRDTIPVPA